MEKAERPFLDSKSRYFGIKLIKSHDLSLNKGMHNGGFVGIDSSVTRVNCVPPKDKAVMQKLPSWR